MALFTRHGRSGFAMTENIQYYAGGHGGGGEGTPSFYSSWRLAPFSILCYESHGNRLGLGASRKYAVN